MNAPEVRPKFGVRLFALLIDFGVILGWMAFIAVVALIGFAITGSFANWLRFGTKGAQLLGFVLLVLPVGLYLYTSEASARQATIGKRVMGLRVVSADDLGRPSRTHILVRTIVKLLPWEVAHFAVWHIAALTAAGASDFPGWLMATMIVANLLPVVYVLMFALQREGRGPHDFATKVIIRSRCSSGQRSQANSSRLELCSLRTASQSLSSPTSCGQDPRTSAPGNNSEYDDNTCTD